MERPETIRYYWSFRSPYAWLAGTRLDAVFGDLPVALEWIPVYPPPDPAAMPNNPTNSPNKLRYITQDIERFAQRYGLKPKWPQRVDTDWKVPHSAYLYARSEGRGREFAELGFAARFERGEDIGSAEVLGALARRVGLAPESVQKAHEDPRFGGELLEGFAAAARDRVFGVPTFVYREQMFWGNDRLEWLADAIRSDR